MAIFNNFQNALIFQILVVLCSRFCTEQLQCVVETCLRCFYAFLFFDPKWRFCKVYSLCLVAIFGNFQNPLIFRILAVCRSLFLHTTTAMCCRNVFIMYLWIFNFWPKVTILQSLWPLLGGHFWQFSKSSHFSNISSFLEPFLHTTTAMCCRMFRDIFMHFYFLTQSNDFAKSIAFAWWSFLAIFKVISFFEY